MIETWFFSYRIVGSYRNKGLGQLALKKLLKTKLFREKRVYAEVSTNNKISNHIIKKFSEKYYGNFSGYNVYLLKGELDE